MEELPFRSEACLEPGHCQVHTIMTNAGALQLLFQQVGAAILRVLLSIATRFIVRIFSQEQIRSLLITCKNIASYPARFKILDNLALAYSTLAETLHNFRFASATTCLS